MDMKDGISSSCFQPKVIGQHIRRYSKIRKVELPIHNLRNRIISTVDSDGMPFTVAAMLERMNPNMPVRDILLEFRLVTLDSC
jgi:hypothetical protein